MTEIRDQKVHNFQLPKIRQKRSKMTRSKRCLKNIKNPCQIQSLFSSTIKNDTEKIFVTLDGLIDVKYSLINRKLYQTIGVTDLNEIKIQRKTKKSARWVNVNFQAQCDNRDAKHFSYNFITKNIGGMLNFTLKLIYDENKEITFGDKEKKNSIRELFA